ncbi:hypothetical protein L9F63_020262, partial [Diploptera punctata]
QKALIFSILPGDNLYNICLINHSFLIWFNYIFNRKYSYFEFFSAYINTFSTVNQLRRLKRLSCMG